MDNRSLAVECKPCARMCVCVCVCRQCTWVSIGTYWVLLWVEIGPLGAEPFSPPCLGPARAPRSLSSKAGVDLLG